MALALLLTADMERIRRRIPTDKKRLQSWRFAQIDLVWAREDVTASEKLLYYVLLSCIQTNPNHRRFGFAWPGNETLAQRTGSSRITVIRARRGLINKGLLVCAPGAGQRGTKAVTFPTVARPKARSNGIKKSVGGYHFDTPEVSNRHPIPDRSRFKSLRICEEKKKAKERAQLERAHRELEKALGSSAAGAIDRTELHQLAVLYQRRQLTAQHLDTSFARTGFAHKALEASTKLSLLGFRNFPGTTGG